MTQLVRKLQTRAALDADDIEAVMALPFTQRTYEAPSYMVREGMRAPHMCSFIRSGFAIRHKLTNDGRRQIVAMNLPGDFVDLQHLFLNWADHNVQVLTRVEAVDIERSALQALALSRPNVGKALWTDTLIDASIFREWVLNAGRRDARQRVAHLLCEFALRMDAAGLDIGSGYELPMTQEQLGDAVGLTSVHINRTLKSLIADGVVQRDRRHVSFSSWEMIRAVGDFSALYLHLDQTGSENTPPPAFRR
jgi:CRP-like cAMP-binding protein